MRHITEYDKFTIADFKKIITKSIAIGDIKTDKTVDELLLPLGKLNPEVGSFEYFIQSDFISHGNIMKMDEYLVKIKEYGIDITKASFLNDKKKEIHELEKELETLTIKFDYSTSDDSEYSDRINDLYDLLDELYKYHQEFDDEIKRLRLIVRGKMEDEL